MRQSLLEQLSLVPAPIDHHHAHELAGMSAVLDALPQAAALIHDDLMSRGGKRIDPDKGRRGMSAEQVLRILIVKQMNRFSYAELAFHLADSQSYRTFCRIGLGSASPIHSPGKRTSSG